MRGCALCLTRRNGKSHGRRCSRMNLQARPVRGQTAEVVAEGAQSSSYFGKVNAAEWNGSARRENSSARAMKKKDTVLGRMCAANEMYRGQIPICMRVEPVYLESFAYRDQTARLIYAARRFLARPSRRRDFNARTAILLSRVITLLVCFATEIPGRTALLCSGSRRVLAKTKGRKFSLTRVARAERKRRTRSSLMVTLGVHTSTGCLGDASS